ncbi:MAG TPA: AraC family transcriptional regulator [Chitinophagaceae bacterium]|nr:AraC family transcriptional regulator [Chitinophagaceae bacterium]
MEERKQIVHEKGIVDSVVWQCDDIRLGHAVSKFRERISYPAGSTNDVVRMHFGLKGDYRFFYKQLGRSFDLIGSHHNMMYSEEFDIVIENKTLEIETFGIQFPRTLFMQFTQDANDVLKRFSQNIIEGKTALLSNHWGAIEPGIQQAIQHIIHCRYSGDLKKLFLLSKSIELLVLCAAACSATLDNKDPFIKTKADKERLIAVRDLVNEKLYCPPNLSEIARIVGLNEYKLKRGFKETFNTTVFGYLAEQRLHLAQRYLRDTKKTAAEISAELGYSTPQHFNNAFRKKFGVTPHAARNNP